MSNAISPQDSTFDPNVENQIELKEVEGLSQNQIVRRRFLRHKGAVISVVVLALITILAVTSVGFGSWTGWWNFVPSGQGATNPLVNGGAPSSVHHRKGVPNCRPPHEPR
ncbi:hypothetical protein ACFWFR_19235, partial [Oerskovia sp. NPDC060287]